MSESIAVKNPAAENQATSAGQPGEGIIVFSHLRWSFVWQRPQQFLSRFAESQPILFIEEPEFILEPGTEPRIEVEKPMANVTTVRPQFPRDAQRGQAIYRDLQRLAKQAASVPEFGGAFDRPLLWFYDPMAIAWALDAFDVKGIVYDCMDELAQFKNPPSGLIENEQKLLREADVVFTGGYELWLKKSQQHPNVHFFGCGVEYDHFAKAQSDNTEVPEDVREIASPVLGWFGVIDERMDYDIVREMAALKPEWNFVFVGPVVKVDPANLPQSSNIYWIGQRNYDVLPNYCKAFDICIMPFALNDATEFINPTKALEYLATGRPVISTAVRDVVRQYMEVIPIAKDGGEFIHAAEMLMAEQGTDRIKKGIYKAKNASWEATVAQMKQLIAQATTRPDETAPTTVGVSQK